MTGEPSGDTQWTERALARLTPTQPDQGLEAGLLAAYEGWNARRSAGWLAGLGGALRSLCHFVWPGVSAWAPVGVFAVSLLLGVLAGAVLPTMDDQRANTFSLDQPPGFSLLGSDTQEDM